MATLRPVPDIDKRDPQELAAVLTGWLRDRGGDSGAEVFDVQTPASNGFSNETILCRVRTAADEQRLVVRVAPTKHLLFLDADFTTQYRVMQAMAGTSGVPLPAVGPFEEDPRYLGVPFFTMEHVDGLVPGDGEPYTMGGWVLEGTPEDRTRMWWSGLEALAAVHRVDWRARGLGWLDDTRRGRPGIEQQMAYYRDYHDWATQEFDVPTLDSTWSWLVAHRPEERGEVVLNWGDSRIGNIIWQDFTCAAVLDWEMATLGQPEMDLGWWLYFDLQFSEGLGMPRPTGFPSHEETIDRYANLIGRPLGDLFFYEVFSGYRFGVIMARLSDLLIDSDILPHESDMATNNFATQLLAKMLDLPAPA